MMRILAVLFLCCSNLVAWGQQEQSLENLGYSHFEAPNNDATAGLDPILFGKLKLNPTWEWGIKRGNRYYIYRFYQFPWVLTNEVVIVHQTEGGKSSWYYKINRLSEEGTETRRVDIESLNLHGVEMHLWD